MSRKKRRKKKSNFIKPFLCTLSVVVVAGIFFMIAYLWIVAPTKETFARFQLTKEKIPEGDKAAEEAQIHEILNANERYLDQLNDAEYMMENNIYAKDANDPEQITLTFAGDILFDDSYAVMGTMLQNGGNIANAISQEVITEMKSADIMMVNNEFPYSSRGTATAGKQFTFRAKPSTVSYLDDLGVDIVSLANNHAYDYGEEAFLDTMTTLEEAGILYVGAGRNLKEARRPVYYIINNMKIAIVAATQIEKSDYPDTKGATDSSAGVFRCWNGDNLISTIQEARENSDFVIAYLHWGTENSSAIDWAQEKQAPEVVAAGADLIIGDHPHCLQKIEAVNGVPVIYSLGNFWFNSKTVDTGMVKITLNQDGLQSCQFLPCLQSGSKTTLLHDAEKERVLNEIRTLSPGVQIDSDGYVTW